MAEGIKIRDATNASVLSGSEMLPLDDGVTNVALKVTIDTIKSYVTANAGAVIKNLVKCTLAEYNAMTNKDEETLYLIVANNQNITE